MGFLRRLAFSTCCFSIVNTWPLQVPDGVLLDQGRSASTLVARQASAVVASSDFYRRAYHASAVVGNFVYIDGGELSYMSNGNVTDQYSTTILSIDLSKSWTNSSVQIRSNPKPDGVPNLNNPSLWYNEQEGLLYSGFAGRVSLFADQPPPVELQLWSFQPDGAGGGSWNEVYGANNSAFGSITRPWRPMMAYGSDNAFLLGGTEDFLTTPETAAKVGGEVALPGLVHFNMTTKIFSNSSAAGYQANGTAERGAMHYVPSFGPNGLFLVIGGDYVAPVDLLDFGTVSIFDPSSKKWYQQATAGNIPKARVEFCTAGVNSTNGTYEIFMYAGWNGNLGAAAIPYDEVYVLTLPGFYWIKARYPAAHPRHGLTCNAVGGSQILTIGGVDTNTALTHGGSGLQLDEATFSQSPDPFTQGLAIFDMTTLSFASQYIAHAPPYVQSDPVQQYYKQNMSTNWSSPAVASLFQTTHFSNVTTKPDNNPPSPASGTSPASRASQNPAPSFSSSGTSVAGIVGGVIGAVVGCALIGVFTFLLVKRRRANKAAAAAPPDQVIGSYGSLPKARKGYHEMYQQPPELGGTLQDEKRAELPEQSMFELDGEDHDKANRSCEQAGEPSGDLGNEIGRKSEPIERPVSPLNGEVSPVKDDGSSSIELAFEKSLKKPTIDTGVQQNERASSLGGGYSRFNEEISPLEEPTGLVSRSQSIRDKALPPKPPLDR